MVNELKNIVLNEVKTILNEISIKDKYEKESQVGKTNLPFDIYQFLCNLDPTTKSNQVGKYANWIIAKYDENAYWDELRSCLEWYVDAVKRNIVSQLGISNDINTFKTYNEFINVIKNISQNGDAQISNSEYNNRQKLEGQFKILGSTSFYDIIEPLTYEAERYFGSNTEWCTVANKSYYDDYISLGPLFIIFPKNGDSRMKMQFHFEKKEFGDKYDDVHNKPLPCIYSVVDNEKVSSDLINLCKKIWGDKLQFFLSFKELVSLAKQYLSKGEMPSNIFTYIGYYYNGLCRVRIEKKWNFIDTNYNLLTDQWYDDVDNFNDGFANVKLKDRWNIINMDGELVLNQWYDMIQEYYNGYAQVYLIEKGWNFIDKKGNLVSKQWYTSVGDFHCGYAQVFLANKGCNFININGEFIDTQRWYDEAEDFKNNIAIVYLNGSQYKLSIRGILYDKNGNAVPQLSNESVKHIYLTNKQYNLIKENKENLVENYQYEYAKDDVDLSSFEKQEQLNQNIWDNEDKLNSRVRLKLLDIADDFIDTLGIKWIKPIDIILTGSLCNYNWSRYSDIDLHVVIDFNEISSKTEFVQEYFNAKKNEWNDLHTDLTIFGFNVELYVENIDNDSVRGGIYSLEKDEWIKKPSLNNISKISSSKEEKIKYFASYFLTKIILDSIILSDSS